jgi:hypothetical protein
MRLVFDFVKKSLKMTDTYSLYDRIYDTLKYHRFYSYEKEVFIDGVNTDFLVDKLMDEIKRHFEDALK